jgi:hypothetical protein
MTLYMGGYATKLRSYRKIRHSIHEIKIFPIIFHYSHAGLQLGRGEGGEGGMIPLSPTENTPVEYQPLIKLQSTVASKSAIAAHPISDESMPAYKFNHTTQIP